jgi:hypothetical protein
MTCTNEQVKLFMSLKNRYPVMTAAAKAGISRRSASKYIKLGKLPSELKEPRRHRTRQDPFKEHFEEIEALLTDAPELQANTILEYLTKRYPNLYNETHLRTLQRRIKVHRAENGEEKEVMFLQKIRPGITSQSDWTVMDSLNITINGEAFSHLLFHFILPYSCWESIMICQSESFASLAEGFERAVLELGGTLPYHRTDNLSAVSKKVGGERSFTERWEAFTGHYNVRPTRNNPGKSHENGSIEKSHDTFKKAVEQRLLLRGTRDFASKECYEAFLEAIRKQSNELRKEKFLEEMEYLQKLPEKRWNDPNILQVKVSASSTIQVLGCTYSVPSRLIGYTLRIYAYPATLGIHFGQKKLLEIPRIESGVSINYRHIIDSLVRKPNAFAQYQYHHCLFPHILFRWAYDQLKGANPSRADKEYLQLLQLAKLHGEIQVLAGLELCQEVHQLPEHALIKSYLDAPKLLTAHVSVITPDLSTYDQLHNFEGILC